MYISIRETSIETKMSWLNKSNPYKTRWWSRKVRHDKKKTLRTHRNPTSHK